MKRSALSLLFLLLCAAAFAQRDTSTSNRGYYTGAGGTESTSGYVDRYQPDITPRCGTSKVFPQDADYDDPTPSAFTLYEGPCKNGVLSGTWKQYYYNRPWLYQTYQFVNGRREGWYYRYSRTGDIVESSFYKNDTLDGYTRMFAANGKITAQTFYVNGKKNGPYFRLRNPAERLHYNPEELHRRPNPLHNDTLESGHYVMDEKDGRQIHRDYSGWLKSIQDYDHGRLLHSENYSYAGSLFYVMDALDTARYTYTEYFSDSTVKCRGYARKRPDNVNIPYKSEHMSVQGYGFQPDSTCFCRYKTGANDSVRWLYRGNTLVWRIAYQHTKNGLVTAERSEYFPATLKPLASGRSSLTNTEVRISEKYWNGIRLSHWEYSAPNTLSSRMDCDSSGKIISLVRYYTPKQDSARWSWNKTTQTWTCYWKTPNGMPGGKKEYDADSLAHGEWITYDSLAWRSNTLHYMHGRLDGEAVYYGKEETVTAKGHYMNGKKSGPWMETEPDGTIITGSYTDGLREGRWEEWYAADQKNRKAAGNYVHGVRKGRWKCWDETGKKQRGKRY